MNVKTVAALVGTLSLGALAEGCASAQSQVVASSLREGSEHGCVAECSSPPLRAPASERRTPVVTAARPQLLP
jgi:hypothetical protein